MTSLTLICIVSHYTRSVNAKSTTNDRSSTSTTTTECYDEHGHLIACPYSKLAGIIVGSIFGAFIVGMIIWDLTSRCKRKMRREEPTELSQDLEASPTSFRKPPSKSWFLRLVPNMFSKYRGVPNRADTPDSAAHDASGATDDEDDKKHSLHPERSLPPPSVSRRGERIPGSEVPNPADTPDSAVHNAFDATDEEDNKEYGLYRGEKSEAPVPPSPTSVVSVPLPPYESIAPPPPVSMRFK